MKFNFAQYTDITDYVHKIKPESKDEGYIKFFICPDVWDYWYVRILHGYNEEYEKDENSYILERNQIPMDKKGENLSISKLKRLIMEDDGCNYDMTVSNNVEELIEILDSGYGIN